MKTFSYKAALLVIGLSALGCRKAPEPRDLTSLRRSGDATFVCVGPDGVGAPLSFCPQGGRAADLGLTVGNTGHTLHALVTQTLSAEVAVIRVASADTGGDSTGRVLDVDPTNPGVTPLRVGEKPGDIVTTPGGLASFVGVAQVGLEGIYALPTSCIQEPADDEPRRDRTSWPACTLSSAPGDIVVLVDEAETDGEPRAFCGSPPAADIPRASDDALCTADLAEETLNPGARKLLVSLPSEGKLVLIDAQDILTRQPGTFRPCHVEAELPLSAEVPDDILQPLPSDLVGAGESTWVTYQEIAGSYESRPAGIARNGDVLLIADQSAPVVHQVDTSDVCAPVELAPLYATSLDEPTRVVTTSEIAVSPVSPSGAQYAYVVDEVGDGRANALIFDLSSGAQSRAPLVRSGSPLLPFEAPDRLEFSAAVKDVGFALLDRAAVDPATGVATTGILCDPDPSTSSDAPGARYRPSSGTVGAAPRVLRGLFGYALLSDGAVSVIDIEDFDSACRRPIEANQSSQLDHRGCAGDEIPFDYFTENGAADGAATVTDEVSCRTVAPHRVRSRNTMRTSESTGVNSPSLRTFGRLSIRGRGLTSSRLTPEGKKNPILLGVDFEAPDGSAVPASVRIGGTLYSRRDLGSELVIDPNQADRSSVVLPVYDPRAHPPTEVVSVTYEGQLASSQETGSFTESQLGSAYVRLEDPNVLFCAMGIQDRDLTLEVGEDRFSLDAGAAERFVDRHTDYVQIRNRLYEPDDDYWKQAGAQCGGDFSGAVSEGYELCASLFGLGDEEQLLASRDLTIVRADADGLELTPRELDGISAGQHLDALRCCFPGPITYSPRAGHQWVVRGTGTGLQHDVSVDPAGTNRCVFEDTPLTARLSSRAFEVSSTYCENDDPEDVDSCGVGVRTDDDIVCSYDATNGPVEVGGLASNCIHDGLTKRFVVYRGLLPSERDMAFSYEVIGGFETFSISLRGDSNVILPVSLVEVPTFGAFGVVDSQNRGLMMIDVPNSQVAQSFY